LWQLILTAILLSFELIIMVQILFKKNFPKNQMNFQKIEIRKCPPQKKTESVQK
jgi:hypothetical protein